MTPDEPTTPASPSTPTSTPAKGEPAKTGNIPRADVDFGNVATEVNTKWGSIMPVITLLWKSQPTFAGEVLLYNTTVTERKTTGGSRKPLNQQLNTLHNEIDTRTENVKGYLEEKYGKTDSVAYYAVFGIVKQNDVYKLPQDRNERITALQLMTDGCTTEGFITQTYGTTYWAAVKTNYEAFVNAIGATDSKITGKVSTKNTLKKEIKKTLNALINVLKGNYPDTWKQELRVWGFQKEKY